MTYQARVICPLPGPLASDPRRVLKIHFKLISASFIRWVPPALGSLCTQDLFLEKKNEANICLKILSFSILLSYQFDAFLCKRNIKWGWSSTDDVFACGLLRFKAKEEQKEPKCPPHTHRVHLAVKLPTWNTPSLGRSVAAARCGENCITSAGMSLGGQVHFHCQVLAWRDPRPATQLVLPITTQLFSVLFNRWVYRGPEQ